MLAEEVARVPAGGRVAGNAVGAPLPDTVPAAAPERPRSPDPPPARASLADPTPRTPAPGLLECRPVPASAAITRVSPETETAEILRRIDRTRLPVHVAAIMDGNGRWAMARGLERVEGHAAGVEAVRDTVEGAARLGLSTLTLFAFSIENWSRPPEEVAVLMELIKKYLRIETRNLVANDIRFRPIGRLRGLPADVREMLDRTVEATSGCRGLTLSIALNYGGRAEIVDAARRIAEAALLEGAMPELDEARFADCLYTRGLPDPDLMIRTSGEVRISNFLLFQSAYTEFWTTPTHWPDFRRRDLYQAILAFQARNRRYGALR